MKKLLTLMSVLLLSACAPTTSDTAMEGMDHGSESAMSQDMIMDRLNNSPRHQEWVQVQNGDKVISTWVVYPERSDNAPVVLLIHENRGLTDWVRSLADEVAEAGYIAVAPDLLSKFSNEYTQTSDFPDEDAAIQAVYALDPEQVQSDLEAVAEYAKSIPASNGKLASAGFCWGGAQSFQMATASDELDAAMVFYGTSPEDASAYASIDIPVFGFYGGNDDRVNATIPTAADNLEDEVYQYEIYDGAGHAFMRLGESEDADPANAAARDAAWERMKSILSELE